MFRQLNFLNVNIKEPTPNALRAYTSSHLAVKSSQPLFCLHGLCFVKQDAFYVKHKDTFNVLVVQIKREKCVFFLRNFC